ncbi:MAG: diaminopimelate decarboxylase [Bacilli bacterium]|jgi:diaminopimelate decarboxylase|nr:diaminopimelate decarboxylase [Bacilli bacterium]MDD2681526.1 diaminopimelate decarboxylase [Bacilli bacterium]MDD3121059.1 diaminopimelate decarboxylase [Bacilli bacterium]MDD4063233.1 diaminopimelate decarboxylase [Bacilli bacterium]MDD4481873.1 diaminopimelate decarboxylase [Bacilli bacterium]
MKTYSMKEIDNELYLGKFRLSDLAKEYKTPLYVYDELGINNKIDIFKKSFISDSFITTIVYASKAFLAPYLCKLLENKGLSIDAVSIGDLLLLKQAKFPMERVIFHGNNKSIEELNLCLDLNVKYIVIDSLRELKRLDILTQEKKIKCNTLFRVNPGIEAHTHEFIQTSLLDSKFGESINDSLIFEKIVDIYKHSPYLFLKGFHAHIGSQINVSSSFGKEVEVLLDFIEMFQKVNGYNVRVLDIGGGFGIKYLDTDTPLDLEETLQNVVKIVENKMKTRGLFIEELLIEPGRSIVGDSGITLYTCGGSKQTFSKKNLCIVDGGMADNIRPALYRANYSVDIANRVNGSEKYVYDVVGKYCESGDIIARNVILGKVKDKDIIVTHSTGAYCYSMSSNYNGSLRPAVIFVKDDKVKEAIKRETYEDLAKTYIF